MNFETNRASLTKMVGVSVFALVFSASLALSAPSVAWATIEGDQSQPTDEEIAEAIASGEIDSTIEESSADASSSGIQLFSNGDSRGSSFFQGFSGADRYEVAVMEAEAAYDYSPRAIIAGGEGWPDALSAAGLAGVWDCPILLTDGSYLTDCTKESLRTLGVSEAIIVGGPNTVSGNVEEAIRSMGISVDRIDGADRYEVNLNVYNEAKDSWSDSTVAIASGVNFPDALSMSPVSFKEGIPIILANASGDLGDSQKEAVIQSVSGAESSTIVIAGGPNSVSYETEAFAQGVTSATSNGKVNAVRLGGADRYEASANIAAWAVDQGYLRWDGVALAMGSKPYDALCGSILQGKTGSVLMVVEGGNSNYHAINKLTSNKNSISSLKIFGGKVSVPMDVRMDVADVFGIPYYEIPELKIYVDAGHGYNDSNNGAFDPGAIGCGYREADLTKELAGKVNSILRNEYGVDTYLNDDGGWYKLRAAEAIAQGCDYIVSIHFNAAGGSGTMSLIHEYNEEPFSWTLQDMVHPRLVEGTNLSDLGQRRQEVAILGGGIPAVLCEVAFIDNSYDMSVYQSRKDTVAHKIAEGALGL